MCGRLAALRSQNASERLKRAFVGNVWRFAPLDGGAEQGSGTA
jgi:hypothetical protein